MIASSEEIPFAAPSRRNSSSHSEINDQSLTTAYLRNPIVEAEIEKWKQKCQVLQTQVVIIMYKVGSNVCPENKGDTRIFN